MAWLCRCLKNKFDTDLFLRSFTVAMAVFSGGLPVLGQDKSPAAEKFCSGGQSRCFEAYNATFIGPTDLYRHGVLGDDLEWSGLLLTGPQKSDTFLISLTDEVFEDVAPRLADLDGDGVPEAVVVQSHPDKGAQLAIYSRKGKIAATPYIGTRYRWLAPVGIADFNGDGDMDVAYVDRPHLAKTLRVWSFRNAALIEIAALKGVTNHRIGEDTITSGIRHCDGRPEMILTDGNRENILSVFFENGTLTWQTLGPYTGPESVIQPLAC